MRRCLAVLLLVLLPLQFTWAAVGVYCLHENGARAEHVGHHAHQHRASAGDTSSADHAGTHADEGTSKSGVAAHPDCATCHAGWAAPMPGIVRLPAVLLAEVHGLHAQSMASSPPLARLERPKWTRLA